MLGLGFAAGYGSNSHRLSTRTQAWNAERIEIDEASILSLRSVACSQRCSDGAWTFALRVVSLSLRLRRCFASDRGLSVHFVQLDSAYLESALSLGESALLTFEVRDAAGHSCPHSGRS